MKAVLSSSPAQFIIRHYYLAMEVGDCPIFLCNDFKDCVRSAWLRTAAIICVCTPARDGG